MILTAKEHKALAATVLVGAALLGGGVSYGISNAHSDAAAAKKQAAERAETLREAAVYACQLSLQPGGLRYIVAADHRDDIKVHKGDIRRTRRIDYSKFGLTVSAKVRRNAIAREYRAIDRQRDKIRNILGVDCETLYPKP